MLQRPLQEPGGERLEVLVAGLAIAKMRLDSVQMVLTGLRACAIGSEDVGLHGELLSDKRDGFGGCTVKVVRHKAHEAQRTELQGIAETVVGGAMARHTLQIAIGQGKEDHEILIGDDLGKVITLDSFGFGEQLDGHRDLRVEENDRLAPRIAWR